MELYDVGDAVVIRTDPVFKDSGGTAADPTTVTLNVREPDGTVTSYTYALAEITRAGAGDYYKVITLDAAGIWSWEFVGTGAVAAATSGSFRVRVSAVS